MAISHYKAMLAIPLALLWLAATSLGWPGTQAHFHENLLPKGWGEIGKFCPDDWKNQLPGPGQSGDEQPELIRLVWRVANFSDIASTAQELIFSPRFYLSEPGYRMQLLLVPNTTYSDLTSYLGVFFRVVAGDYDAHIEWPYKHRTVLSVLEHSQLAGCVAGVEGGMAQYNHTVIPNIDECRLRSAFLRPNSDIELGPNTDGCGNRRQMPLSELEDDRYMQDDTLLVLVSVYLGKEGSIEEHFRQASMSMRYNELVSNYVWNISEFKVREKNSLARNKIAILTSSPFYTHSHGYLIQLFLTILPKRNAFAISTAFVQGDHDRYLQWPFPYAFEMAIIDQSPDYWKRDITVRVKPSKSDCGHEAFGQPSAQPEFCFLTIQSLQVLSLPHYNFLINDTLRIRFTTRFERYSSRQRSSILLHNKQLVSEFNWLIPGIMARFERLVQDKQRVSASGNSSRPAGKKSHRFVSDEFYTNGQGYLCQLVLTVSLLSVPASGPDHNQTDTPTPLNHTQDVLVFGLELVIIEGEFDRFLDWPFNKLYELSIVGYKPLEDDASEDKEVKGHLYSFDQTSTSQPANHTTNSQLMQPSVLINSGKCSKESFQKPIERNPPCGVKEFVQMNLAGKQRQARGSDFTESSITKTIELGTIGRSEEDLHLRVRIYL